MTDEHRPAVPENSYQQLAARYERLMEISRQLNSTLDLGTLLSRIVRAATELTGTEVASILLVDPTTGELRFEAASNLSGSAMAAIPVPIEGSLAGWVVTHGAPELVQDAQNDARWFGHVDKTLRFTTRNLLAVPMKLHDSVIGVVEAINKREGQPWTQEDVDTLGALANQAATAVQNARLFQQSDFIAEMVHELRTPLVALKASTTLLLRPDLPANRVGEIIASMQSETDRLIRMTSDFLDLARLESGRTRLDITNFELDMLLHESVEVIRQQAEDKRLGLKLQNKAVTVRGDRGKLKQVLLNLLTNAVKYNREGGSITIHTRPSRDHDRTFVELSVADTGFGISSDNQKNMFQKFYRAADTAGFTQGTGLGLAIAKHIIEAHNGHIWLESEPGAGSTFYITIPCASNI